MGIIYKEIPDIDCRYKAGSDGFIYSFFKPEPRKLKSKGSSHSNYFNVSVLLKDGKRTSRDVHRLVCLAFHGKPKKDKLTVAHLDGNSKNNLPSNLQWCNYRKNLSHKFLHNTHDSGTNNSRSVFNKDELFVCRWLAANTTLTDTEIGEILGVSKLFITKINNRHRYKNIEVEVVESVSESKLREIESECNY